MLEVISAETSNLLISKFENIYTSTEAVKGINEEVSLFKDTLAMRTNNKSSSIDPLLCQRKIYKKLTKSGVQNQNPLKSKIRNKLLKQRKNEY